MTIPLKIAFERSGVVRTLAAAITTCTLAAASAQPPTAKRPVTDTYHGVAVVDNYRWLENGNDPAVKSWSDAQNSYARSVLDTLPNREALRDRITQLHVAHTTYSHLTPTGGAWLALKHDPRNEQPAIVIFSSPDDLSTERVILNPSGIDPRGSTTIDWFVPSPDAKVLAVSLSQGGSERGDVHLLDIATGKDLKDTVPRVHYGTAGGSLAWAQDGSGFYYTRYPRAGERQTVDLDFYTQVYFHKRSTPTALDRYEIGERFPRIAEITLRTSPDGRFVLANVANGDGGEFAQYLRQPDGRWSQLTKFEDKVVFGAFGVGPSLYLMSRHGASKGKILRLPLSSAVPKMSNAKVVVPESPDSVIELTQGGVEPFVVTRTRLYTVDVVGGPHRIRTFELDGRPLGTVPTPDVATISEVVAAPDDSLLFSAVTFLNPGRWLAFSPGSGANGSPAPVVKEQLSSKSAEAFARAEVVREVARSKDGTAIPLSIVRRAGISLDGRNPTILIGYGGYGINYGPFFMPAFGLWLEHGGVLVVANIRGGGEFGEVWHLAGNLTRKQNVFDDFIASAEHLIQSGYTSNDKLAILGGSNGGLLMGAALTQRPELFKAVVSYVGIYDMLRVELSPNGSFNVPEFGTVTNPAQFQAMYAYSPYHRVKDATTYPATLFLTGANDPRVDPMQSRKMIARLQAAMESSGTVLLRTTDAAGHGFGTAESEAIDQDVDVYTFLFNALGVSYP